MKSQVAGLTAISSFISCVHVYLTHAFYLLAARTELENACLNNSMSGVNQAFDSYSKRIIRKAIYEPIDETKQSLILRYVVAFVNLQKMFIHNDLGLGLQKLIVTCSYPSVSVMLVHLPIHSRLIQVYCILLAVTAVIK